MHQPDLKKRTAALPAKGRRTGAAVLVALSLILVGCTPMAHRISPYSDRALEATALEAEAMKACRATRSNGVTGISKFATDGCTFYPDGEWVGCCIEHDIDYWCGGSTKERKESDRELRRCITEKGYSKNGSLMHLGVRLGGHPLLPLPWRWGYGWSWPRGYEAD